MSSMSDLYVIGGRQREARRLLADERTWYEYDRGVLMRLGLY